MNTVRNSCVLLLRTHKGDVAAQRACHYEKDGFTPAQWDVADPETMKSLARMAEAYAETIKLGPF